MLHRFVSASFCFICLLAFGSAASGQRSFQTFVPGLSPAQKRPAVQTSDGGFCVLAESTDESGSHYDFALLKTRPSGTIEWARHFTTPGSNDRPIALRGMPDGGFIAMGITSIPGSWNQNILVQRLNAHGYPVWSRTYDFSELDWATDLVTLEDGGAVIVGSTYATDSAAARAEVAPEVFEEYGSEVYRDYTNEKTLALRIDADGEIVWSGYLKDVPDNPDEVIWKGFGQAICRRNDNTVTLVEQVAHSYSFSSFVAVNLTLEGAPLHGLWMHGADGPAEPGTAPYANDLVPLPDGGCLLAGVTRYFSSEWNTTDDGFLLRLDSENKLVWHRTYAAGESPLPLTLAPMDGERFLIAGRTVFHEYGRSEMLDNPVIALVGADGVPTEAKHWMTSFQGFPTGGSDGEEATLHLYWPYFIPTDDQSVFSIGSIYTHSPYSHFFSDAGLILARFNPDLTLCGDATEAVEVHSAISGEAYESTLISFPPDQSPIDVMSADYRTYADWELGMADTAVIDIDVPNYIPPPVPIYDGDYYGDTVATAPDYTLDPTDPVPADEEDLISAPAVGDDPDYDDAGESYESEYSDNDQVLVQYPDTMASGEYEYEVTTPEATPPIFSKIDVTLVRIHGESLIVSDVDVEEFDAAPFVLCESSPAIGASPVADIDAPDVSEYLNVLPNSVEKGKNVAVEFGMIAAASPKPEVRLVNVGSGQVVYRVDAKNVFWSGASGSGGATIETAGLSAGVYMVEVRAGERQLSAKLRVR